MEFECSLYYFKKTIRETVEDFFFIPYLFTWVIVQFSMVVGLLFPAVRSFGFYMRENWNGWMSVPVSTANQKWADYNLWSVIGFENWAVCDKVMFRYWLFHPFNELLPEMNPFLILKDLGIENSPLYD